MPEQTQNIKVFTKFCRIRFLHLSYERIFQNINLIAPSNEIFCLLKLHEDYQKKPTHKLKQNFFLESILYELHYKRSVPKLQRRLPKLKHKYGRTPWTSDQLVARPLPKHRQHKHRINTYTHQTFMPCVGFEPTISASERVKTVHALDRSATVTGFQDTTLQNSSQKCYCIPHVNSLRTKRMTVR
jgi:hypothetical protein